MLTEKKGKPNFKDFLFLKDYFKKLLHRNTYKQFHRKI